MCISGQSTLPSAPASDPGVAILLSGIPHLPAPSLRLRPPPQSPSLTSPPPFKSPPPFFSSSPSCHPKHAQGFFLLLERTACSQRREGRDSEERRKISFCGGRGAREEASSVEMRVQKAIKRNKASRPALLPGCQRGEASSLTRPPICKRLCLSLDSFQRNKNKPRIQPTSNCLIAVVLKRQPPDFSCFHLSSGAIWYLPTSGNV
uniref:Uncharacterized protein n=1 Tax=Pipistrellus kuhlii TaxID=59472 RepID=A0A7J7ZJ32_PIPKU|nr:hypothetical protein mPipKuh1_009500 [Pipistrellus kuhlii]